MKPATVIRGLGNVFMLVTLVVGKPTSEVNVDSSGSVVNLQGSDPGRAQITVDMPGQVNMNADGQALVLLLSEKGQGLRVDINGVLVSDLIDDNDLTTLAPEQVTTPPVYQTQPPVPQTSQPPVPQTSQPPLPQTSQPPVPQTSQPPVPQTSQPPVPQTSQPPVPQTSQPPVPQTSQPPVPQTTKPPVQPTTQGPPKINHDRNCLTKKMEGYTSSGIYTLQPFDCCPDRNVDAPCDMTTDGGGWTVIQRRQENPSHQEDFYRTWDEYVDGFGDLTGEFWLGLDNIHALTNQTNYEIRIDLEDWDGTAKWAQYSTFLVKDRASNYKLQLGSYSGDAGNSFAYHNMMPFSAKDGPVLNECPKTSHGGWWYNSCHYANLNGVYRNAFNLDGDSIAWFSFRGPNYSLKFSEMKIRPTP